MASIPRVLYRPEIGAVLSVVAVMAVFYAMVSEFLTVANLIVVLTIGAELGIVTAGETFLMISGEFDLSVGAVFALTPLLVIMLANQGVPMVVSFILAMALSALIGYLNGLITLRSKIPSFITTLGVAFAIRGLLLILTGGFPVKYAGTPTLLMAVLGGRTPWGFRVSLLWFIAIVVLLSIVLELTPYGNHVFAVGGNPRVAEEMGISPYRVKMRNFVLCSLLAGFAGCLTLDRLQMVDPLLATGMELESIAAAAIGGTSLFGGYGSIVGAALGAIVISMTRCGLVLIGTSPYWYGALIGVILVIAAIINKYISEKILTKR